VLHDLSCGQLQSGARAPGAAVTRADCTVPWFPVQVESGEHLIEERSIESLACHFKALKSSSLKYV
jgi:hypothetical protein